MQNLETSNVKEAAQILFGLKHGNFEKQKEAVRQASLFIEQRNYFPEVFPLLIQLLEQESHPKLAEEAAWALWKFKDPQAIPVLLKTAKTSPHFSVQEKAIRALGLLEAREALAFLCELASYESYPLKATAITALGFYKSEDMIPILALALKDKLPLVRKEAVASLGRFLRRDPKQLSQDVLKQIKERTLCKKESDVSVRIEALTIFSYLADEVTRKHIEEVAVKDNAPQVRAVALELLQQWSDNRSEASILQSLQDWDWIVRYKAAELLIKIFEEKKIFSRTKVAFALARIAETFPVHIPAQKKAFGFLWQPF